MAGSTRRRWLQAIAVGATGLWTGCTGAPAGSETATGPAGTSRTTTDGDESLTEWERSTDCKGEHDGMHDSVIAVERVTDSLDNGFAPITFSELTSAEKDILRTVTEEGGYGTCDVSDAFTRFIDRVSDRQRRQEKDGVFLKREDTYYKLYVEKLDQVYAY